MGFTIASIAVYAPSVGNKKTSSQNDEAFYMKYHFNL